MRAPVHGTVHRINSSPAGVPTMSLVNSFRGKVRRVLILTTLLSLGVTAAFAGFIMAPSYNTGGGIPIAVAVGDFNGDGVPDLAVVRNSGDVRGAVVILLGKGDGSFEYEGAITVGVNPQSIVVGDFNRDGIADLAVTNGERPDGTVSILLGRGDGTFQGPQDYTVGSLPLGIAVGDFNGDGTTDLAVANVLGPGVSILLGNGDGSFGAAQDYHVQNGFFLAVGDFNGDGKLDLVTSGGSVLLGNGDGTFHVAESFGAPVTAVAVGDFNGDGIVDLAVAGTGPGRMPSGGSTPGVVTILLGKGDGTFQAARTTAVPGQPLRVAVGDLDGDGIPDLVIPIFNSNMVSVLLGKGDGNFQNPQTYLVDSYCQAVAVGDFNGDSFLDAAVVGQVADGGNGMASILLGKGDGTFPAARSYDAGTYPNFVAVGDFNGDGHPNLAVADFDAPNGTVSILLGTGDGNFRAAKAYAVGGAPGFITVADLNGDGALDLVVTNGQSNTVSILLGILLSRSLDAPRILLSG